MVRLSSFAFPICDSKDLALADCVVSLAFDRVPCYWHDHCDDDDFVALVADYADSTGPGAVALAFAVDRYLEEVVRYPFVEQVSVAVLLPFVAVRLCFVLALHDEVFLVPDQVLGALEMAVEACVVDVDCASVLVNDAALDLGLNVAFDLGNIVCGDEDVCDVDSKTLLVDWCLAQFL